MIVIGMIESGQFTKAKSCDDIIVLDLSSPFSFFLLNIPFYLPFIISLFNSKYHLKIASDFLNDFDTKEVTARVPSGPWQGKVT